ncbi:MAG: methionyl-tRNA formyltransferase [Gammaproteobacteria bacterium]|nr:methionyl-tRNA formyltransferase [Gammaproteobacteria bacterium]
MNATRIGFAGTPAFAADILAALINAERHPVVVFSQPDRPTGRGKRVTPSPVKQLAEAQGIPVCTPTTLRSPEAAAGLAGYALDVLVVAAYGLILPETVLRVPRHGCLNVHASLLPRWRGAAPIERAIMAGDTQTGISIMQMDAGLDTGPVLLHRALPIEPTATGQALGEALAKLGAELLCEALEQLGELPAYPQVGKPTYAHKLAPADSLCDWTQPALVLERQIRALAHRAPVVSLLGEMRVGILAARPVSDSDTHASIGTIVCADKSGIRVACAEGQLHLELVRLNRGQGQPLTPADLLNGYGDLFHVGARFHDP